MTRRVAVIGAGAVGTVLASAAEAAGHAVTVCGRRPASLVLERDGRRHALAAAVTADPSTVDPVDWVLLATKAYDVESVRPWLAALLGLETVVVVCQNGIDHVARLDGTARAVPAVVGIVAQRIEPGLVLHRQGRALTVADDPVGAALAELFGAHLDIVRVPDLDRAVWLKFLGNLAAAPVTTLTMRPLGILGSDDLHPLLRRLMTEAVEVAIASGVDLRPSDVEDTLTLLQALDPAARSSMQTDRAGGRPLETEALTGALVRRAASLGVPVPWNETMLALLRHSTGDE